LEKLVSIVILNWNGKDVIFECLKSLEKLDYPNYEIVVVDNGSTDGSCELLEKGYPDIKLVKNRENLGVAQGINIGVKHSTGEYVLLLNNDTIVDESLLKELLKVLERGDDVGVVGPKIYYFDDPQRIWAAGGGKINWRTGDVRLSGGDEIDKGQYESVTELDYVSGCALLTRKDLFCKIGYMDESFFAYFEETDWCVRASNEGYRLLYVPKARMWHKVRASSRNISGFHEYQMTRNMFWFLKKHLDKTLYRKFLLYFFLFKLWYQLGVYIFYLREFSAVKPFFRGLVDGIS
jgi:GT2 family glycosyltransferase